VLTLYRTTGRLRRYRHIAAHSRFSHIGFALFQTIFETFNGTTKILSYITQFFCTEKQQNDDKYYLPMPYTK